MAILARIIVMSMVVVWSAPARALDPQRAPSQYLLESWSEGGLPNTDIEAVIQTPDGYLWFGTSGGLTRYDGASFELFDRRSKPPLPSEQVRALALAGDGRLYVATDGGLFRREAKGFSPVAGGEGDVRTLAVDARGMLWWGGDHGVTALDARHLDGLGDQRVRSLGAGANGDLWIVTWSGLDHFHDGAVENVALPATVLPRSVFVDAHQRVWIGARTGAGWLDDHGQFVDSRLPGATFNVFAGDRDGNLWLGGGAGLFRYRDGRFSRMGSKTLGEGSVRSLFEDSEGSLWFGGSLSKLFRLRDGKLLALSTREGLADEHANTLYEDAHAVMWVGSPGGLDRVEGGVVTPVFGKQSPAGLPTNEVRTLLGTRDGALHVGTTLGDFIWDGHALVGERAARSVSAMFEDRTGRLFLGTDDGLREPGGKTTLAGFDVRALAEDTAGNLWIGSLKGVARRASSGELKIFDARDGFHGQSGVLGLYGEPGGAMWIGTVSDGLIRYRDGRFVTLDREQGLPDYTAAGLLADGDGNLWIGAGEGIFRASLRELNEVADGRAARVSGLLLNRDDGMRGASVIAGLQPTSLRARDGKLWFGTDGGVVILDPRRLPVDKRPPPVVVTRTLADDQPVEATAPPGTQKLHFEFAVLWYAVPRRAQLRYRLDGYDHDWRDPGTRREADYTNLPPGRYRFRVKGANGDGVWNERGAAVELTLLPLYYQTRWFAALSTLLGLGLLFAAYRWRVRRILSRQGELARLVEERTASLRAAQTDLVRAERMASVATLVRGVAHELNNPIGFISSNIEPLRRYSEFLAALARRLSDGTARSTEELAALTRFTTKKDLDYVCRDLERMMEDITEGARRAQLIVGDLQSLTADSPRRLEAVDLGRAVRQTLSLFGAGLGAISVETQLDGDLQLTARAGQLEQVLVNLIDNAVRAMPEGGRLRVCAEGKVDQVTLALTDSGAGMSEEVRRRAAEPFFTTRPAGQGSGLGLAIVASIVRAHGGTIRIESAPAAGTTVEICLPRTP